MSYSNTIYKLFGKSLFILFLFFNGTGDILAGNLGDLKLSTWFKGNLTWEDDRDIELEGRNINSTYAVSGIKAKTSIWLLPDTNVYAKELSFDDVPPSQDFKFNLGKLDWSKLKIGVNYEYRLKLEADFDEDTTNNHISQEFMVIASSIDEFEQFGINFTNYPNPFTETAFIKLNLEKISSLSVNLLDMSGRKLMELASGPFNAGEHILFLDGSHLESGVFLLHITVDGKSEFIKIVHTE